METPGHYVIGKLLEGLNSNMYELSKDAEAAREKRAKDSVMSCLDYLRIQAGPEKIELLDIYISSQQFAGDKAYKVVLDSEGVKRVRRMRQYQPANQVEKWQRLSDQAFAIRDYVERHLNDIDYFYESLERLSEAVARKMRGEEGSFRVGPKFNVSDEEFLTLPLAVDDS